MSRPRRSLIVAVVALASAAFAPVAADAAAPLAPPLSIDRAVDPSFEEPSATALAAGVSDDGDAAAAWRGSGSTVGAVKLALWRAGAPAPAIVDGGLGSDPDLAMTPGGHALAAWTGSDGRLRISFRQPGGAFPQSPTALDPPGVADRHPSVWGLPSVALRADGSGLVAVPGCIDFGGSADVKVRLFDVAADGSVAAAQTTEQSYSVMGCAGALGVAHAAVGAGGRASATHCIVSSTICFLAIRAGARAAWTVNGVDGTQYAQNTGVAELVVAPGGRTIVVWRSVASRYPTIYTAIGTDADAMSFPQMVSDGSRSSAAPQVAPLGDDALALFQTGNDAALFEPFARPLFASGTLGDTARIAPATQQPAAPFADPHAATWPDGSGVIALATQPTRAAQPALTLQQRSLGGTLTPLEVGPQTRAVTLPRVALAGTPAQPLGLVATREQPAPGGGPATIVLRRIDGVPPRVTLELPRTVPSGTPVRLRAVVSDASGPVTVGWSFGDGGTAQGAEVEYTFGGGGARTVVVTATDALGNATGASGTVEVVPGNVPDVRPPARPKPVLSRVSLSARRFRAGRANTAPTARVSARRPRRPRVPSGTTVRLTSSERAGVNLAVVRVRSGRTQRGKCRASARRGRRCTIRTTVRRFIRVVGRGASSFPFSARFGGRALPPGSYELRLVATGQSGLESTPRTVRFTLVR